MLDREVRKRVQNKIEQKAPAIRAVAETNLNSSSWAAALLDLADELADEEER